MSAACDEDKILRGLAALSPDALAALARALEAGDWGAALGVLRAFSAELAEQKAALRDVKITLAVQRLELGAQAAALKAAVAQHEKRS